MRLHALLLAASVAATIPLLAAAQDDPAPPHKTDATAKPADVAQKPDDAGAFHPEAVTSDGSVSIGGHKIDYQAVAGTLVVHPKGWDDAVHGDAAAQKEAHNPRAEASMFYVAYFAKNTSGPRPVTFIYNGGPGSSTVWLHMGAFGPRRVVTADDSHTPPAPYQLVNNDQSLLDASDLVFIDMPGAGFSRVAGPDKEKAFWGIDADAHAFAEFITQFLGKYGRWNSPKYLFGESYGTTRSAVLAWLLESEYDVDLNGVMLLSQILAFDLSADRVENNPGVDLAYELALPTYAATALYHHKLPGNPPADLPSFLHQVEHFALSDYAYALAQGALLPKADHDAIVEKLHEYTGLPAAYIAKANLRVDGSEFEKTLQTDDGLTTGRLDTRFSGPEMDPLSKGSEYDPQSAALSSAYIASFNDYARHVLHYGDGQAFKPSIRVYRSWDSMHQPPGANNALPQTANVMPDLAAAMKMNPTLHVQLNTGYYDMATPYFEGEYELRHLPMPAKLQDNIEIKTYQSGHMVYAHASALAQLHDNAADFIKRTEK